MVAEVIFWSSLLVLFSIGADSAASRWNSDDSSAKSTTKFSLMDIVSDKREEK